MELLANELSLHKQFHDIGTFRAAFSRIMVMRTIARRYRLELHCQRDLLNRNPIPGVTLQMAIKGFPREERRAALVWLTRMGPFWEDIRRHTGDDYLECRDDIVTDTAIGEAAFRKLHGVECNLVSFSPSEWEFAPVKVTWRHEAEELEDRNTALKNWWNGETLEDALRECAPPIQSWRELAEVCPDRFEGLTFSGDCFEPLINGVPFARSSADRMLVLLGILDALVRERDDTGEWTEEGHRIYRQYFMGDRALFSDSSTSEKQKQKFRKALAFRHPEKPGGRLFCPWHGKESHLMLRLHFSWPPPVEQPVHVVYAGPKITKR